jgi:hypothetical protein
MRSTLERGRAIWSAIRHTFRRLLRRAKPARAGIESLMSIAAVALCAPQPAQASIVTATITGVVTSGTDISGVFGPPKTTLTGKNLPYKLVATIDDTKGSQPAPVGNPPYYSDIVATATSRPITATLTINGVSVSSGYGQYSLAQRDTPGIPNTGGEAVFGATAAITGQLNVQTTIYFNDPPFILSYNWESPLSYAPPSTNTSFGGFSLYTPEGLSGASGRLSVTSITVSGPPIPQISANGVQITGNLAHAAVGLPVMLAASPAGQTSSWQLFNGSTAIPWAQVAVGGFETSKACPAEPPWPTTCCPQFVLASGTPAPNPPPTCTGQFTTLVGSNFSTPTAPTLFWTVPGRYTVEYQYTLSTGQSGISAAVINVEGPTQSTVSTDVEGSVTVTSLPSETDFLLQGLKYMASTNTIAAASDCMSNPPSVYCFGVSFTPFSVTFPSDYTGSYQWVQLIKAKTLSTSTASGTTSVVSSCPSGLLDNTYPYPDVLPDLLPNGKPQQTAYDGPFSAVKIPASVSTVTWTFTADMYLMWQATTDLPSGTSIVASTIPVPLGYVEWGFTATAMRNSSGGFSLSSYTRSIDGFVVSIIYPQWSGVALNSPCS